MDLMLNLKSVFPKLFERILETAEYAFVTTHLLNDFAGIESVRTYVKDNKLEEFESISDQHFSFSFSTVDITALKELLKKCFIQNFIFNEKRKNIELKIKINNGEGYLIKNFLKLLLESDIEIISFVKEV